jgi:hypothetical protein
MERHNFSSDEGCQGVKEEQCLSGADMQQTLTYNAGNKDVTLYPKCCGFLDHGIVGVNSLTNDQAPMLVYIFNAPCSAKSRKGERDLPSEPEELAESAPFELRKALLRCPKVACR